MRKNDVSDSKISIIMKNGVPVCLGSLSFDGYQDDLHRRIWEKAHDKSEKDGISLLKALKIQIKRAGFIPEEVNNDSKKSGSR